MGPTVASHIECKPSVCGGKPCIAGTRIRVQDIYDWHEREGFSPDEIVTKFPQLTLADVYAALSYYWDHREAIERASRAVASSVRPYSTKAMNCPSRSLSCVTRKRLKAALFS